MNWPKAVFYKQRRKAFWERYQGSKSGGSAKLQGYLEANGEPCIPSKVVNTLQDALDLRNHRYPLL